MGNCMGGSDTASADPLGESHNTEKSGVQGAILRERFLDVYKKYEEVEVLGKGSMGHVAKVQIKDGMEGGSAFAPVKKNALSIRSSASMTLSERRAKKVDYALKSIQLDRVSPQFLQELRNEIDILKSMVRRVCSACVTKRDLMWLTVLLCSYDRYG